MHLHIQDCSAVGAIISKRLIQQNESSFVLQRMPYFLTDYYKDYYRVYQVKVQVWMFIVLYYLFRYRPKYVWMHSTLLESWFIIPLSKLFRFYVIYWSHGSDLRHKRIPKRLYFCDLLLKSTNSISCSKFKRVRVPVDSDLFYPEEKIKNTALHVSYYQEQTEKVIEYCHQKKLTLQIIYDPYIEHAKFVQILRQTEYYIESKGLYPERSKIYYEAKASGCKVIEENTIN